MVYYELQIGEREPQPEPPRAGGGCNGCSGESRCGNGLEKIYPTTAVRFGYMKYIGEFSHEPDMKFSCGAKVVIKTQRGLEIGEQVSLTCGGCSKSVTRDQIRTYITNSGADSYVLDAGQIMREATEDDLFEYKHIRDGCFGKRKFCQSLADQHNLPIKIVDCEHLFGGERIIFFFMAEGRVDFRALVKDLAHEYQTRIEMRQVGARDEARLVADYETCGQECCCKVFLKTLKPVSMKMAKMQKATLDPSKVSGRCGRLKCCLRYEHTSYEELDRLLPNLGSKVRTAHGDGVVVNRQILTQLVQIERTDGSRVTVVVEDVQERDLRELPPAPVKLAEQRRYDPGRPRGPQRPEPRAGSASPQPGGVRPRSEGPAPYPQFDSASGSGVPRESGTDGARHRRRGRRRPRGGPGPECGGPFPGPETPDSAPPGVG
ncbi:MAG TPA: regulatory iron-sulfur-containing complex subunit RicT [Phycisphaerae bacterium]|jgi:cell fate regulator YaaT (PSP1 superfamily)